MKQAAGQWNKDAVASIAIGYQKWSVIAKRALIYNLKDYFDLPINTKQINK